MKILSKKLTIIGIIAVLVMTAGMSTVYASSSSLSSLQMGSWQVDPSAVQNWKVDAGQVDQWFSASWGTNVAESAGAVNYPYQFLYGNFFFNGKLSAQSITVNIAINWTEAEKYAATPIFSPAPGDGATGLGAPSGEVISTGIGSGAVSYFSGYPIHVYVMSANGTTLGSGQIYTSTSTSDYSLTLQPTTVYNGTVYVEMYAMMYTEWNAQPIKYFPLYIGVGKYTQLVANVQGSTSLVKGLGPAYLNFTFNAGNWSINFDHVLNGNPQNMSATNLQVLRTYHFTYASTGGNKQLIYNFTSSNPPGIYVWTFNESVTKYGSTYVVHDLRASFPPKVLTWMSPGKLDGQETVSVTVVSNVSQENITVYVSVWYGTDEYMLPPSGASNVLYSNSPFQLISGQNFTLTFKNTMDGQLNLQVIANASGNLNLTRDFTTIGNNVSSPPGGNISSWFVWPPWSGGPVNELLLLGGGILVLYSLIASAGNVEVDETVRKAEKIRNRELSMGEKVGYRMPMNLTSTYSAHFGGAIILLVLSVINWDKVVSSIPGAGLMFSPLVFGFAMRTNIGERVGRIMRRKEEGGVLLDGIVAFLILLLFILVVVNVFHANLHVVEYAWSRFWGGSLP